MKALSLWEPWASLMACGAKKVETRSWPTHYRGQLLICASLRKIDAVGLEALDTAKAAGAARGVYVQELKYGQAVCVVRLIRCDRIVPFAPSALEHQLGDYTPGRFAWVTTDLRHIWPFKVHGRQGLFDVADELISVFPPDAGGGH